MKRLVVSALLVALCVVLLLSFVPMQRPARMVWQAVQASSPQLAPRTDVETHTRRLRPSAGTITIRLDAQIASGDLA